MDTRPQETLGLIMVNDVVQVGMKCGWQGIDHINDNGIDGLILDRIGGVDTGSVYYVQVKCGHGYVLDVKKRPNHLCINLSSGYINAHRPRWNRLQGPVILVYVDPDSRKAWWTDLKSDSSYCPNENKSIVIIPRHQRFGSHSIGQLRRMRGFYDLDRKLDVIQLTKDDLVLGPIRKSQKEVSREFYKMWADYVPSERMNPSLGEITISRVGWRHITRRGRGYDNIVQSWTLLGAAKRILLENSKPYQLYRPKIVVQNGVRALHDCVSLRSRVIFPNRQETVVQVVVKRNQEIDQTHGKIRIRNWFYSVHEPRKGKKMQ